MQIPFTQDELAIAVRSWGCNCGPAALAVALNVPLEAVRVACEAVGFEGWMNPSLMLAVAEKLGRVIRRADAFSGRFLWFVQWTGPWTDPDVMRKNPKWSYRFTHWVAVERSKDRRVPDMVFDVNAEEIITKEEWVRVVVPALVEPIKDANGLWEKRGSFKVIE